MDLRNLVAWKAAESGMLADHVFVRRAVDAVELVIGDVAVDPLDLWSEIVENRARSLRCMLEVCRAEFPPSGHFPFNHILGHFYRLPGCRPIEQHSRYTGNITLRCG